MNERLAAGVLGAADGATSIAGVIAGGAAAHVAHSALAVTALGGALAATVSMGGAELLSQDATDWGAVVAMGLGTLGGSAFPAVPLFVAGGRGGALAVVLVTLGLGVVVGWVRAHGTGRHFLRALGQTLAVLGAGGFVGYGAGRLL